jgi:hypothetical protein
MAEVQNRWETLGAAFQADGETKFAGSGLKHQKEKRSMDHFAGLDVPVKDASVSIVDGTGEIVQERIFRTLGRS